MARTERERAARPRGATPAELREAERGLRAVLAPTFSARWIAQNLRDLLNQANVEYAEWLRDHRPASNPPGWLVQRARWRALDLVERENRQAGPPLDSVVHSAEDPEPTPEEAVLERDRHRRIAEAMSHIPEKDRRLLALVYGEGHSIRAAGRLLGWGKSSADSHHAEAMKRLRALIGPRELLSPSLVGLAAQAAALRDRPGLLRGIGARVSAALQDLVDPVARTVGSASRSVGEAARRSLPFTDAGATAASGGGAGRLLAQCGALAGAAICSAIIVSSPPVEQVLPLHPPRATGVEAGRGQRRVVSPAPTPSAAPGLEEASRSSAVARSEEARRIERRRERRRRRARERRRRRARIAHARRARKERARAKAARVRRNESIATPEEVTPEVSEPAPEVEAPEVESAPPPATGEQTRQEFGL
jgi:RNA polymerase sigma factor (sigma-70 family)